MTRPRRPRRVIGALIISALIITAAPAVAATREEKGRTPTLPAAPEDPLALADMGPLTVGLTTVKVVRDGVPGGFPVDVWYPAKAPAANERLAAVAYDVKDWLPADVQAKVGRGPVATFQTRAIRDRAPLAGHHPVVLFSHGYGGYRMQSSDLLQHLVSWGFVVVAPEHVDRDLPKVLANPTSFGRGDVADLTAVLAALRNGTLVRDPLRSTLDVTKVAAVGHSAGANAAISLSAADGGLSAVVALGGGASGLLGRIPEQRAPILWIAARNDRIFLRSSVVAAARATKAVHRVLTVESSGHMVFADICEIGKADGGPVGIAKKLGVQVPPSLQLLGTDGCNPPNLPVTQGWPVVRFATVSLLRSAVLGSVREPSVLTQPALDRLHARGALASTLS